MASGSFNVGVNESVNVTIGRGGGEKQSGGTTSFGTYLSANGGNGPDGGTGGGTQGITGGVEVDTEETTEDTPEKDMAVAEVK